MSQNTNPSREGKWESAVKDACTIAGELGWDENDPAGSIQRLIDFHVAVATDPRTNGGFALTPVIEPAAAKDVIAERSRQIHAEGWTPERDDHYQHGELVAAAATYALCTDPKQLKLEGNQVWTWGPEFWKPTTYRRNLVKAGALILAEIERIDRTQPPAVPMDADF